MLLVGVLVQQYSTGHLLLSKILRSWLLLVFEAGQHTARVVVQQPSLIYVALLLCCALSAAVRALVQQSHGGLLLQTPHLLQIKAGWKETNVWHA